VEQWVDQYRVFWTKKLDAPDDFLKRGNPAGNKNKQIKKTRKK
jgi:hypothetical protein